MKKITNLMLPILLCVIIALKPQATYPLQLYWNTPTTNTDGSPVITQNLKYNLYYGPTNGPYAYIIPGITGETTSVSNDITDTTYFSVAAYTDTELESELSKEFMLTRSTDLPIFLHKYFSGTEFIINTNSVLLSWILDTNATSYRIFGVWTDTSTTKIYNYGSTAETYKYIPMSRAGHFYYYISLYNGTTLINKIYSTNILTTLYVHGYTNQTPWRIYWKLPSPSGIIVN